MQRDIIDYNKQRSLNRTNLTYSIVLLYSTCAVILGFQVSYSLGETEGYKTYTNNMNGVEIQYPEDWQYKVQLRDPDSPETIFQVGFYSPTDSESGITDDESDTTLDSELGVSVRIDDLDKLKPTKTLEQYKDRVLKNLKEAGESDVKDISATNTTLSGEPAYRIEDTMKMIDTWEKSIDIDIVKNGKLYEVSASGTPEEIDYYMNQIDTMFNSVKIN